MKMHGDEFIKELISRSKENDEQAAIETFLRLFVEKATGTKESAFKRSMQFDDDSIMMFFKNITRDECVQVDDFLKSHLQPDDYHAEGGACVPASGYPKEYTPARGELVLWVVQAEAALNKLLPAVGFAAPAPTSEPATTSIITSIKNSLSSFLFPPAYDSDDEMPEPDSVERMNPPTDLRR